MMCISELLSEKLRWLKELKRNLEKQDADLTNGNWENAFKIINKNEEITKKIALLDEKIFQIELNEDLPIRNEVTLLLEDLIFLHENVHKKLEFALKEFRFELNQVSVKKQLIDYLNRNKESIDK